MVTSDEMLRGRERDEVLRTRDRGERGVQSGFVAQRRAGELLVCGGEMFAKSSAIVIGHEVPSLPNSESKDPVLLLHAYA